MGTTAAIDCKNGSASLVAGWDQTLTELGIAAGMDDLPESMIVTPNDDNALSLSQVETIPCATPQTQTPPHASQLNDTRDRMRAEVAKQTAAADGFTTNPWVNMAGHLAQKASQETSSW
jgi:hypothetical protein